MLIRRFLLVAALIVAPATAFAQGSKAKTTAGVDRSGSSDDQAACRPDVRKHCSKVEPDSGDLVFLACLKEHRDKLRKPCLAVLERNGQ
jgi:Cysteine rich repeat